MDQSHPCTVVGATAMPTAGPGSGDLLLPGPAGVAGESALHALAGPGVYRSALLRRAQDDGRLAAPGLRGGTQTGEASAAGHGVDGGVSQAPPEPEPISAQALSVSVEGRGHRASQPGLELRYHLHPAP